LTFLISFDYSKPANFFILDEKLLDSTITFLLGFVEFVAFEANPSVTVLFLPGLYPLSDSAKVEYTNLTYLTELARSKVSITFIFCDSLRLLPLNNLFENKSFALSKLTSLILSFRYLIVL